MRIIMLICCKSNLGKSLPLTKRYMGETDQTIYSPLKKGDIYQVFAMFFIADRIDFLVCPPEAEPAWVPSILFDIIDYRIPNDWGILMTEKEKNYSELYDFFKISCIIGYKLIISDYNHYKGILEGDEVELIKFHREKMYQK